jgi:transposase
MPKKLSPEFRRKMLNLVKEGRAVRQVATDPRMRSQTIYVWPRQHRIDAGLEPGLTSSDHAELVTAQCRTVQLETELAVSRRAG